MEYKKLLSELKTLNYPVAYDTFKKRKSPPFITILYKSNDDIMADNINYVEVQNFQVELYTKKYRPTVEKNVETLLKNNGLAYEKFQTYLKKEELYQTVYRIKLIGG